MRRPSPTLTTMVLAAALLASGCNKAPAAAENGAAAAADPAPPAAEPTAEAAAPAAAEAAPPAAEKPDYEKLTEQLYAPDQATFDSVVEQAMAAVLECPAHPDKPHLFADDTCGLLANGLTAAFRSPPATISDAPKADDAPARAAWRERHVPRLISLISARNDAIRLAGLYGCKKEYAGNQELIKAVTAASKSATLPQLIDQAKACLGNLQPTE